jgi:hypothetical protein
MSISQVSPMVQVRQGVALPSSLEGKVTLPQLEHAALVAADSLNIAAGKKRLDQSFNATPNTLTSISRFVSDIFTPHGPEKPALSVEAKYTPQLVVNDVEVKHTSNSVKQNDALTQKTIDVLKQWLA